MQDNFNAFIAKLKTALAEKNYSNLCFANVVLLDIRKLSEEVDVVTILQKLESAIEEQVQLRAIAGSDGMVRKNFKDIISA